MALIPLLNMIQALSSDPDTPVIVTYSSFSNATFFVHVEGVIL